MSLAAAPPDATPRALPRLLVVDDERGPRHALALLLASWGHDVAEADSGEAALALLEQGPPPDAVLLDIRMPGLSGLEVLERMLARLPGLPVLIMTAYATVDDAVQALKAGAVDFLTKPLNFDLLRHTLSRALEHDRLRRENEALRDRWPEGFDPGPIVGVSAGLREALRLADAAARADATVLITGESGTGKELIARAVHANSARRHKALVSLNCAALSPELLESELFGHEKGSFTGADRRREGRFIQAHGGTLFLDEIGELAPLLQAKLLRALQEGEIQRVGSDTVLKVDARIIAATNRDLETEAVLGRFRLDLFYRLNVLRIHLPSLRERPEDVAPLARHFLAIFARKYGKAVHRLSPEALDRLTRHAWPGNIRELENAMERGVLLTTGEVLGERVLPFALPCAPAQSVTPGAAALHDALEPAAHHALHDPAALHDGAPAPESPGAMAGKPLDWIEKEAIRQTLALTGGNKSEAARLLGISRVTLHKKLNEG